MNFEKIELIGFKSFADKCEIVFDNGVTAIVGPNGCGKSNIADAIRWVMGEQSAKTLRGSAMTDVIFNGTQNRKSLSYCEVSLYFDNSQRIFKSFEYNEVILTRKLFRSGESEYYINKQPARMRDIIDLLHECGVSKSGYSIIGQGKVAEILSSKPTDRRVIFEEAVGIAKSKTQKLENERKLERTRENILRLNDILEELRRQYEPAQRSKDRTQKFLDYSEQLKYHEINNYLYKREHAEATKDKITVRINAINEALELNERELAVANENYNQYMSERDRSDEQIASLHDQILNKSLDQEKLQGQSRIYNERISFFKTQIQRLNEEIDSSNERLDVLVKALEAKNAELVEFAEESKTLTKERDKLTQKLNQLITEIADGENLSHSTQSEIIKTAESIAGINMNIGSLSAEQSVFSDRQREVIEKVERITSAIRALEIEKQSIEKDIAKNESDIGAMKDEIDSLESTISKSNDQISKLANAIYSLNLELNNLKTNLRFYENVKESFEGYPTAVKRLMSDAKRNEELSKRIKGVVGNIIKTDKKYEQAIESSIGNAVQNIVTATPEDAQYLLEYLKRAEAGRATFLPISSVKPHVNGGEITSALKERGSIGFATELVSYDDYFARIIEYLLGNTLVVDTSANALTIAKKYRFNFKIVTLDGDIFNPSGTVTGGSRRSNSVNFMSTERNIQKLSDDIKSITEKLAQMESEKATLTEKSNSLVEKLNLLEEKLSDSKKNNLVLTEKLNSINSVIADKESQLEEYKETIDLVKTKLDEIAEKYQSFEENNKRLAERRNSASSENDKILEQYEKLKAERDEIVNRLTEVTSRLSYIESAVNSANNDVERLKTDIADTKLIIEKDKEEIQTDQGIIESFYHEIEALTLSIEESSGLKELRDKLSELEQKKQKLGVLISQADLKRQICTKEIEKLVDKKHEEEISIAKVDSELEFLEQRISEAYQLTYEECVPLRDPEYDHVISNQEIDKLKHKIAMLGNINANAIEEFNQLEERINAQQTQIDDLYKAESDLKEAIKELTDDMMAKFNEGFEQIRTHFQKIFKELFGGGRADLILDYEDVTDPLDAGVEIVAEPPGKKLQKISLLSGGEMSLTAIAILFAILKLRPMPFCVLDEIEAALDDANVERFARYLKNFSKETQFVVITHKKVTMELSDALFGVTMQEKGVSKIVSVKLSDITQTLEE